MFKGKCLVVLAFAMTFWMTWDGSAGVPQTLNYQAWLRDNQGQPVTDTLSMSFTICCDSMGGGIVWGESHPAVGVDSGAISLVLGSQNPIPDTAFTGGERWLEVTIDGEPILPRLQLSSVPYAAYSGAVNGFFSGSENIDSGSYNIIGGDSNMAVGSYNLIGAGSGNIATGDYNVVCGGTNNSAGPEPEELMGKGRDGYYAVSVGGLSNHAYGSFSVVVGGYSNVAGGNYSGTLSGYANVLYDQCSVISGGLANYAEGAQATVSGGRSDTACGDNCTVGGGRYNTAGKCQGIIKGEADDATVGGGYNNKARAYAATIAGGNWNNIYDNSGTIGGGLSNTVGTDDDDPLSTRWGTVSGGQYNTSSGVSSTVSGGAHNSATGSESTVGGGGWNRALAQNALVAGGSSNDVYDDFCTISGGYQNDVGIDDGDPLYSPYATVAGGWSNKANDSLSTVAGGAHNTATGKGGSVGGGAWNRTLNRFATVPGGNSNDASGEFSFAAGRRGKADYDGCFVWADATDADFHSTASNEFSVRATGGVRLVTGVGPQVGARLPAGSGAWEIFSDRNSKENFTPIDRREILDKVGSMPLTTWNYKTQDASIRHMGPMAQDFFAAFGLGEDEKHIATVDADGVALAAIQALYEITKKQEAEISGLKEELAKMQEQIEILSAIHHDGEQGSDELASAKSTQTRRAKQ